MSVFEVGWPPRGVAGTLGEVLGEEAVPLTCCWEVGGRWSGVPRPEFPVCRGRSLLMVLHTGPHIDNETLGVPHLASYFVAHLSLRPSSRNRLPARSFLCWPASECPDNCPRPEQRGPYHGGFWCPQVWAPRVGHREEGSCPSQPLSAGSSPTLHKLAVKNLALGSSRALQGPLRRPSP